MPLATHDRELEVCGERLRLTYTAARIDIPPEILTFHGTGKVAGRNSIAYLIDALAVRGFSAARFDFSGHGDSTGIQSEKTLTDRLCEAHEVATSLGMTRARAFIGTSMGAYVALRLAGEFKPDALILFCPALYPESLRLVPFDSSFRKELKKPYWYCQSALLQDIDRFTGDLLIIGGTRDDVTPPESIEMLYEAAEHACSRQVIWISEAGHRVHDVLRNDPALARSLVATITKLLMPIENDDATRRYQK